MIIVITTTERNERSGRMEVLASHGIDQKTDRTVILPCEPPAAIGAVFDDAIGEYVIRERLTDDRAVN